MVLIRNLTAIMISIAITGCTAGQIIQATTAIEDYSIDAEKDEVFDASLIVAQMQNLDVNVLEKESGLIRFETASLSPSQLDRFCEYPAINPNTGQPWDTFQNWNTRSLNAGGGQVQGRVSISILITEVNDSSNMNMRSNWVASNSQENLACNSTGIFEEEYVNGVLSQLGI